MKPSEMRTNNGLIVVTMGPTGHGKTTTLLTLLESRNRTDRENPLPSYLPCAVFDVDGKAHVLSDDPDIDVYPCHTWAQVDQYLNELEAQSLKPYYKTVCWDGTALLQTVSQEHANVFGTDNPQIRMSRFGQANQLMIDLASRSRVLAERGLHVIFNVWSFTEKDTVDTQGLDRVMVDLTKTLQTRFIGQLDFVVYLECAPPPNPYPPIMHTGGSQLYATKTAISPESKLHSMPNKVYNPSYTSIFDAFHGYDWPTAKHTKPTA